ncbi:MAG TPA: L,D-transpeptidase family protein [Rhizomicrobium sp.]|jgi:lipoprotein-anchoring transpeptidase ErfK/SrfK
MLVRQLSAFYLLSASVFTIGIVLSQHPTLNQAAKDTAHAVGHATAVTAVALNDHVVQPGWRWTRSEAGDLYDRTFSHKEPVRMAAKPAPKPVQVAKHEAPKAKPQKMATAAPALRPQIVEPKPDVAAKPDQQVASAMPRPDLTPPRISLAPQAQAPLSVPAMPPAPAASAPAPSPAELVRVTQRLKDSLTSEMVAHFELFLYVSKADRGPWAQRMYVFQKQPSGDLKLAYNWPVSTGRELVEFAPDGSKQPSFTPAGYYQIDPSRMFPHYTSSQWHQPMPYAMFFNWENHGYQTGLAIHAASGGDISLLGQRSSAGCVRLAPENARVLFSLIRENYKGLVPKFAYDKRTATMANDGMMLHDTAGGLEMAKGYKVLVFIEDYGGENVVAALF